MDENDLWFDRYWADRCNEAVHNSQSARSLYDELIRGLRTGRPGVLSHPDVREFLASRIEAALEAPPAKVGAVMGINGKTKNRGDSPFGDARHRFIKWWCKERVNNDCEPKRMEWPEISSFSGKAPSDSTIDKWVQEARECLQAYIMFSDVN